jgi:hypothetical protein
MTHSAVAQASQSAVIALAFDKFASSLAPTPKDTRLVSVSQTRVDRAQIYDDSPEALD